MRLRLELYEKLNEAAVEAARGDAVVEHAEMMRRLNLSIAENLFKESRSRPFPDLK